MARRIVRHIKHQYEVGVFLPFKPGEIVDDDHPFVDHWFIVENSVVENNPQPGAPRAPRPTVSADTSPAAPAAAAEGIDDAAEETVSDHALGSEGATRDDLIAQAAELGLTIDRRWGVARLQAVIDEALK
jgi:hypothetical protein